MMGDRWNGLMVNERIYDSEGLRSDLCVGGYRCLICGNLVDTVILDNRSRSTDVVESIMFRNPRMPQLVAV
ncbi:MAG: hypothetical protein SGJ26_00435 [Nitrospirota bacterium]|nr:hypothetical protein [Nitrospirota bacterium]